MMLKIAITGNIAAGKSTVENILKEKGFSVFDTDLIAHGILTDSEVVVKLFKGFDVYTDGKIDRQKVASIVFNDAQMLKQLEAIIHPLVREELLRIFAKDYKIVFVSVPQLFEAGFNQMFDKIIYITADKSIRLKRLMKRFKKKNKVNSKPKNCCVQLIRIICRQKKRLINVLS